MADPHTSRGVAARVPPGARDLLPAAYRFRRRLRDALMTVFHHWGYEPVATPALEYYDVLRRGLSSADAERCVRFIDPRSGALLALRADPTPQIARMVAQRVDTAALSGPVQRLCYAAEVVRQPAGASQPRQHHQVGVELIGDADPGADAELTVVAHAALCRAGVRGLGIDLADVSVVYGLLDRATDDPDLRAAVLGALARKDTGALRVSLQGSGVSEPLQTVLIALADAFGPPSVIDELRAPLRAAGCESVVDRLAATLDAVRRLDDAAWRATTVDLGEVRGFDYYTGLRIRGWAPGVGRPVLRGGRYDDLVGRYGPSAPGAGFAIDLEALQASVPRDPVAALDGHLVAFDASAPGHRRAAAAEAARLRAQGQRAWVEPADDTDAAKQLARGRNATAVTFVAAAVSRFRRGPDDDTWQEDEQP